MIYLDLLCPSLKDDILEVNGQVEEPFLFLFCDQITVQIGLKLLIFPVEFI